MNPAIALFFTAVMIHCGTCAILPRTKKFRSGDYFYGEKFLTCSLATKIKVFMINKHL